MKFLFVAGLLTASAISTNVNAVQVDMKAGLWEHTFKIAEADASKKAQQEQMLSAMKEMKKQYENMPAEQRRVIDQMMEQQGIKVTDDGIQSQGLHISKDGTVVKVCVTQEQISAGEMPTPADNCEQKITQTSPKVLKMTYICKGDNPFKGESEIVFQNSTSYTGKGKFTTTVANKSETYYADQTGKWLSSDCGNIKPRDFTPPM